MNDKIFTIFSSIIRLKNPHGFVVFGKLSNYPACDILWFLLRWKLCTTFKNYSRITSFLVSNRKYKHIPCPFCRLKNFILRKKPKYYTCKDCGWQQLGTRKCKIKGIPSNIKKGLSLPNAKHNN